ncbi:hypothetical protein YTPLAS18_05820 [Nitrospira sp.]|nr:hypothetical protein YTPLAS18_05820 [Nitrospira sp.]
MHRPLFADRAHTPERAPSRRCKPIGCADYPLEPLSVVILDSDEEARRRWRLALHACVGVTIVGETERVGEAIHLARRAQPHLIILDPQIPDWNEQTIVRALRQRSSRSVLLVATTMLSADRSAAILAAGAAFCFDKLREFHVATHLLACLRQNLPPDRRSRPLSRPAGA